MPAARAQSRKAGLLYGASIPGRVQGRARVPRLSAILVVASQRSRGDRIHLRRIAHGSLAADGGQAFESCGRARLAAAFPADAQGLGYAGNAQARDRRGDRPCAQCARRLRRARFERLPRAPSHVEARSLHRHLDRHLGHHHGGRGKKPSRPGSRHAGQCRCARRSRADRALHGRTGVCDPCRRDAGRRRRSRRRGHDRLGRHGSARLYRSGRTVRRAQRADRGRGARGARSADGARHALRRSGDGACA